MKKSLLSIFGLFVLILINSGEAVANYDSGSSAKLKSEIVVIKPDYRAEILENYLIEVNSPLAPYSKSFIKNADKYNLDWRLLVSIAGLESDYGKRIPANSNNGWGWGYNNGTVKHFVSWDEAIEEISRGLRQGYLKELDHSDPYVIGPTYAASPTWADRVTNYINRLEEYKARNATTTLSLTL